MKIIKSKGVKVRFQLGGGPDYENPESVTNEDYNLGKRKALSIVWGHRLDIAELFSQAQYYCIAVSIFYCYIFLRVVKLYFIESLG